jgi:hypothetical protein
VTSRDVLKATRNFMGSNGAARVVDLLNDVLQQRYSGDISVFPRQSPAQLMRMFSNPTPQAIAGFIRDGERATWPKLERIRLQTRISRAFEDCLAWLKDNGSRRTPVGRKPRPAPVDTRIGMAPSPTRH